MFEAGFFPGVTYYLSWWVLTYPCALLTAGIWSWQLVQAQRVRPPVSHLFLRRDRIRCIRRSARGERSHSFCRSITDARCDAGGKAAISKMNGIGGKPAWAWIFILEGLVTVIASVFSFWFIVDFPEDATFLTEAERTFVIRRLQGDDQFSAAGERLQWKNIVASLTDWKTYLYGTSLVD